MIAVCMLRILFTCSFSGTSPFCLEPTPLVLATWSNAGLSRNEGFTPGQVSGPGSAAFHLRDRLRELRQVLQL